MKENIHGLRTGSIIISKKILMNNTRVFNSVHAK